VRIAALGLVITAGLGWRWSQTLEVTGLALGLSAGTWVQAILLSFGLRRHLQFQGSLPWLDFLRQFSAALSMGLLTAWVSLQWDWTSGPMIVVNWAAFLGILLGAALLYLALVLLLRDPHARSLLRLAFRRSLL
jgi:putative peptidoglycan lipid II flippase